MPICSDTESHCVCTLERDHDEPHQCGACPGSWTRDENGELQVVRFPNGATSLGAVLAGIFGPFGDEEEDDW